jgi:hypothetical protein
MLPDCRAYELVSPEHAAGTVLAGVANLHPAISPDGEQILGFSFGAFDGAEELAQDGFQYGDVYEMSRVSGRWVTEVEDPPAAEYPFHVFQPAGVSTSDLGRSLWLVPDPLSPGEEPERAWLRKDDAQYVLREGPKDFVPVGPAVSPEHEATGLPGNSFVKGVSRDMTHIVFAVAAVLKQLWSGDSTVGPSEGGQERLSLYEYRGTVGGEPVLVGVRNEGGAPWVSGAAHVNEGAQLVSECGTQYDAMSASGERVFFTALHEEGCAGSQPEVDELYARADGSQTVAISEPSKSDCSECDTTVCRPCSPPGGSAEVAMAGAAEDGSKVYFTTGQPLLAGASGESLYVYDFDGASGQRVKLIAPEVTEVPQVSADGSHVYFMSTGVLGGANMNGEVPVKGASNLYAYDSATGSLAFVASGVGASAFDTTRSGEFLVFRSAVDLKGTGDSSGVPQIFEYDAASGTLVRVSVGQRAAGGYECATTGIVEEGYDCDGNTTIGEDAPSIVQEAVNSVSENGTVVFTSELPLTPQAVQGRTVQPEGDAVHAHVENVYEYEAGQVYLISPADEATPVRYEGAEQGETRLFGIDESGRDVFFATPDSLVPEDSDTESSWYDAREDGGFPGPLTAPGCVGESCQGPSVGPPALSSPLAPPPASENLTEPAAESLPLATVTSAAKIRAQHLAKALKRCRRKVGRQRKVCEKSARAKYGARPKLQRTAK